MIVVAFIALIIAAWIDWKRRIIPDWLTLPLIGVAVLYHLFIGNLLVSILSGVFVLVVLLVLAMATKGGIGGGDIKLLTFLAIAIGFPMIGTLIMISFLMAILFAKIMNRKEVPLAPAILLGFIIVVPLNL